MFVLQLESFLRGECHGFTSSRIVNMSCCRWQHERKASLSVTSDLLQPSGTSNHLAFLSRNASWTTIYSIMSRDKYQDEERQKQARLRPRGHTKHAMIHCQTNSRRDNEPKMKFITRLVLCTALSKTFLQFMSAIFTTTMLFWAYFNTFSAFKLSITSKNAVMDQKALMYCTLRVQN